MITAVVYFLVIPRQINQTKFLELISRIKPAVSSCSMGLLKDMLTKLNIIRFKNKINHRCNRQLKN